MELIELTGFFTVDYGAPSPTIISNDNKLFIIFYSAEAVRNDEIVVVSFKFCTTYRFGSPSNETIQGHPYYALGLRSGGFYELKNSDLIKQLQSVASIHPNHNAARWQKCRHFILTFHDNMFECVAEDFEVRFDKKSIHDQALLILEEHFKRP